MKYYVVADTHGYFDIMSQALEAAGYFADEGPKRLLMLGDLMDRGRQSVQMQAFVYDLLQKDKVILIRGNHEDLLEDLVDNLDNFAQLGLSGSHHFHNSTVHTVCDLAQCSVDDMMAMPYQIRARMRHTPFMRFVMPAMRNYYETEHYVFVHGWIPCINAAPTAQRADLRYDPDWRQADLGAWNKARWTNGMDAAALGVVVPDKTVVCGHWHCSYGHALDGITDEFGPNADYSPYYGRGVIAIDACTAASGQVNVLVLDD